MKACDLVIVGGGPAGLCAAINAASEGLRVAIIDSKNGLGGQAKESADIENYPGFPEGISGAELTAKFVEQAAKFKADILCPTKVVGLGVDGIRRIVTTDDGEEIVTSVVILASGLSYRRLDAKNIPRYIGRGILYGPPDRRGGRKEERLHRRRGQLGRPGGVLLLQASRRAGRHAGARQRAQ